MVESNENLIEESVHVQRAQNLKTNYKNSPTHTEVVLEESTEYNHIQDGDETLFVRSRAKNTYRARVRTAANKTGHSSGGEDTNVKTKSSTVSKDSGLSLSQSAVMTTESPLLPVLSVEEQDDSEHNYGTVNTH